VITPDMKESIVSNAEAIRQLHDRVHRTFQRRDDSVAKRREWIEACQDFQTNYDRLAFPGGYWTNADSNALQRIVGGDEQAMEAAICFLEIRPYFFRSGYMFKDILRKAKKAPLSKKQSARLKVVLANLEEWRRRKRDALSQSQSIVFDTKQ
jgi:hypothetical protein